MATSMPHMRGKSKPSRPAPEGPSASARTSGSLADKISVAFLLVALFGMIAGATKLAQLDAKFILIPVAICAFAICWVAVSLYAWKRDKRDKVLAELNK